MLASDKIQVGDLVQYICNAPRDLGVVIKVYEEESFCRGGTVHVLWEDGVAEMSVENLEVVNEREA